MKRIDRTRSTLIPLTYLLSKMKSQIYWIQILCIISYSFSFQLNSLKKYGQRYLTELNTAASAGTSSITALIRKGKKKEAQQLLKEIDEANGEHYISKFLTNKQYPPAHGKPPVNFHDYTYSKKGTLKVFAEYNLKAKTGFILGLPPPEVIGDCFRDTVQAVVLSMDKRNGGCSINDFSRFTIEQYRARKSLPGPVPIVWNDYIVEEIQIIQAAALGGSAVVLQPEMTENLELLVKTATKYELGSIIMAKDMTEVQQAIDAGAKSICLHNLDDNQLIETFQKIQKIGNLNDVQLGAKLRAEGDFSTFAEVDLAWTLRDTGFNFIWPSTEAVFANNIADVYTCLLAMRAKAAREFYSPRQYFMERNKEGSQEYLGDILY